MCVCGVCAIFSYRSSEVRVWTLGGDLIYTLSGHTSFVYSITVLPNGDIASSGEDRTLRVWKGVSLSRSLLQA